MGDRLPAACDARKDDLVALALGEPLDGREDAVREHAAGCAGCRAYLAEIGRTVGAVRTLPQPEPSAALTERILAAARDVDGAPALRAAAPEPPAGLLARWAEWVAAALRRPALASAVVAVALASLAVVLLVMSAGPRPEAAGRGGHERVVARVEPRAAASSAAPSSAETSPVAAPTPGLPGAPPSAGEVRERDMAALSAPAPEQPIIARVSPAPEPNLEGALAAPAAGAPGTGASDVPLHVAMVPPSRAGAGLGQDGLPVPTVARGQAAAPPAAEAEHGAAAGDNGLDSSTRFYAATEITTATGREQAQGGATETQAADRRAVEEQPAVPAVVGGMAQQAYDSTGGGASRDAAGPAPQPAYRAPGATTTSTVAVASAPPPPPPPAAPPTVAAAQGTTGYAGAPAQLQLSDTEGWAMDEYGAGAAGAAPVVSLPAAPAPPAEPDGDTARQAGAAPAADDEVVEARRRLEQGETDQAEALLENALRSQDARGADVTYLLAETYTQQGKWSAAARTYELFLARYLDDARADEARWRAADAYRRSGAVTRATALLEQLVGVPGYDSRARTVLDELTDDASRATAATTGETTATPAASPQPAAPAGPAGSTP